jgi:TRAP-type C4-dicarboxylate transport system permease small subunit
VERILVRALETLVGSIMLAAVVINLANIVGRYVFSRPFVWAEETMQFLHVWAVMLGAAVITQAGSHLRMDALYHAAPPPLRRALDVLGNVAALAVSLYVIARSLDMVRMLAGTGQKSVIAGVPMHLMYAALPMGFGCAALFLVLRWLGPRSQS